MSIDLSGSGQYLGRASALNYNAPYTVLIVIRPEVGAWTHLMNLNGPAGSADLLYLSPEGKLFFEAYYGSEQHWFYNAGLLADATWAFIAIQRTSVTSCTAYVGTSPTNVAWLADTTNGGSIAGRGAASNTRYGSNPTGGEALTGLLSFRKDYEAALSLARIKEEFGQMLPVDDTDLWGAWTLRTPSEIEDVSGNSRPLSVTGSPGTGADPDVPYSGVGAALSGTGIAGITEDDLVTGGKVYDMTLSGATWKPN
jgi:hypothetical protein